MSCIRQKQRCARVVCTARRRGFTLVELLTVIAIIGVLMSLLLAAVQGAREMARKMSCANNVRNQIIALQDYHAAQQRFPPGRYQKNSVLEYGWSFYLLPHLEQQSLYSQFDQTKPWDSSINTTLADMPLKVFRCPSTPLKTPGKSDYCGVMGSIEANIVAFGVENGIMVSISPQRPNAIRLNDVTDGASNTIIVGESVDRLVTSAGRWVSSNCILHDDHHGGKAQGTDLFSFHPVGAHAGFADGRVQFIPEGTSEQIISAICTRACGELINSF